MSDFDFIVYHQVKQGVDCPDGIMAAAIAALRYPDAEIVGDSYRHESEYGDCPDVVGLSKLKANDRLIIVDFSYPAHWLRYWECAGVEVTVIDHHAPKFPMLEGFSGAILDKDECGATLTWKTFFPDRPMPLILSHVRRRDIGADGYYEADENCRDSKAITAKMAEMRHSVKANAGQGAVVRLCHLMLQMNEIGIQLMQEADDRILAEEDRIVSEIAGQAVPAELCGHICGKVQTLPEHDRFASQVGNAIARAHPEWAFAWIVASDGKGNSLRSTGFDVSAIAQQMGGGGHTAAAGFQSKIDTPRSKETGLSNISYYPVRGWQTSVNKSVEELIMSVRDAQNRAKIRRFIVDNGDNEDLTNFDDLARMVPPNWFEGMTVDSFMEWAETNFDSYMSQLELQEAENRIASSLSGIPCESDLEDALSWAEGIEMQGTPKQIQWARSIASNHVQAIALAQKQGKEVPTSAKWWIDNRSNIVVSLPI